jgi:AcrR family transcriptional regulator
MPRKNLPDAKNRILQAAVKVFAAKSFEGSRVEEIAEEANVPKSLIYYHFESKEQILRVLLQDFINEYTGLLQIAENDTHQSKAAQMLERKQHYRDFFVRNADLVRIILMDSLKKSNKNPIIYQVIEAFIATDEKFAIAENSKEYDRNERMVAEFFTNIIPLYTFLCFHDSWIEHFGMEERNFEKLFFEVSMATHGAYHKYHP